MQGKPITFLSVAVEGYTFVRLPGANGVSIRSTQRQRGVSAAPSCRIAFFFLPKTGFSGPRPRDSSRRSRSD
jgi:hypothetical protein